MGSSCIFCDELVVWCSEWYGEVFQCFDAVGWATGRAWKQQLKSVNVKQKN